MSELNCIFCKNCSDKNSLIEINQNAVEFDSNIIEFSTMIKELFAKKVKNQENALICESCKDLLIEFYIFSENVKKNNENFKDYQVLTRCKDYLNEFNDVQCIEQSDYLMLVPSNKFKSSYKSMETMKTENNEQSKDMEFEYQIEEIETYEPRTESLDENIVVEEDDIPNDLGHSTVWGQKIMDFFENQYF